MPRIAFQGEIGAYGHQACLEARPDHVPLPCPTFEDALEAVGDSLLVMGDTRRAKVHVHTDAPERAAEVAAEWGIVEGLKADDMRRQEAERTARLAAVVAPGGLVAVAEGAGLRDLLAGLGAAAVAPGAGLGEASVVLAREPAPDTPAAEVVVVATSAISSSRMAWWVPAKVSIVSCPSMAVVQSRSSMTL